MTDTRPVPIFIALEPDAATCRRIDAYKQRVRELVGDQLYLGDPPHMTLYHAAYGDEQAAIEAARRCARALIAPQLTLNGWHTFAADPLTGCNTLVLDFTEDDRRRLRTLQQAVIAAASPGRDQAATLRRLDGRLANLTDEQRDAACACGFPFIGDGWHPHFTIASIQPDDWPAVAAELLDEQPTGPASCPRLNVYKLVGHEPELLASFDLRHGEDASDGEAASDDDAANDHEADDPSADLDSLKDNLTAAIWSVVDRHDWIVSATITGSFLTSDALDAISDVDVVVVVTHLNGPRFETLQADCDEALRPVLAERQLGLRINPTLGPRKLNDAATAVLHLMPYSCEGHRAHVISSPFTCLDWQRSRTFRKLGLEAVYPVFALQPHHFVTARRGVQDYLRDFERSVVSYRELDCTEFGCEEVRREEPMTARGRIEYAYHTMRFLMQNLLKLVRRSNAAPDGQPLVDEFLSVFPRGADDCRQLYLALQVAKRARQFDAPIRRLAERLRAFLADFEAQFRAEFIDNATRHVLFRHAATRLNAGTGHGRRFVGRLDPNIEPVGAADLEPLAAAVRELSPKNVYASPARRCQQSLDLLRGDVALPPTVCDWRLAEIDYGACDGLSVEQARRGYPALFAAWQEGEDPRFPNGENTADVLERVNHFSHDVWSTAGNTLAATHNVVLRCIVGQGLGVPRHEWTRIQPPHLAPITVVETRRFGRFVDLDESVERRLLADFLHRDVAQSINQQEAA